MKCWINVRKVLDALRIMRSWIERFGGHTLHMEFLGTPSHNAGEVVLTACLLDCRELHPQSSHLAFLLDISPEEASSPRYRSLPTSAKSLQGPLGHFVARQALGASAGVRKQACSCLKLLHDLCSSSQTQVRP